MPGGAADGGGGGGGGGVGGGAGALFGGCGVAGLQQQQDGGSSVGGASTGQQVDQVYQVLKQAGEIRTSPRPGGGSSSLSSSSRQIVGPPAEPRALSSQQLQQHPQHPNSLGRPGAVATLNVTSPPIASSSGLHGPVCD